jgi:hypothetical protein
MRERGKVTNKSVNADWQLRWASLPADYARRSQAALYGNKPNTDAREKINSVLNVLRARRAACERLELSGVHSLARRRFPPANQTFEPNYPGGGGRFVRAEVQAGEESVESQTERSVLFQTVGEYPD